MFLFAFEFYQDLNIENVLYLTIGAVVKYFIELILKTVRVLTNVLYECKLPYSRIRQKNLQYKCVVLVFSNIYKDEQWNMFANTNERIQRT